MSPSSTSRLRRLAETLVLAAIGGAALGFAGMPAGWLSGAVLVVSAAALAGRPVYIPEPMARVLFVVLGISLGSGVTPERLATIAAWPLSLAALVVAMSAVTVATSRYLRHVHGWDPLSALLASLPGALSQALALAADTKADIRAIAAVHSVRLLVLAVLLPAVLAALGVVGAPPPLRLAPPFLTTVDDLAILFTTGTVAAILAFYLRVPGGLIVGAMVSSGVLHGLGMIHPDVLPGEVATVSFVVLGALIGTRLGGIDMRTLGRLGIAGLGALGVGSIVACGAGAAVAVLLDLPLGDVIVAYAPGGLETMAILAFALHLDPAFVGVHHLVRFIFVSLMMPFAARAFSAEADTGSARENASKQESRARVRRRSG
jgi:membrane AbrB-like protein